MDLSEFLPNVAERCCPECGAPIEQKPRGRKKYFCCDEHRLRWNHAHPRPEKWSSMRVCVCPVCGKEFTAVGEYNRPRKYCSHACANIGRAREKHLQPALNAPEKETT